MITDNWPLNQIGILHHTVTSREVQGSKNKEKTEEYFWTYCLALLEICKQRTWKITTCIHIILMAFSVPWLLNPPFAHSGTCCIKNILSYFSNMLLCITEKILVSKLLSDNTRIIGIKGSYGKQGIIVPHLFSPPGIILNPVAHFKTVHESDIQNYSE